MDLERLSDPEVTRLIGTFKSFIEKPIQLPPLVGCGKDDATVEDSVNGIHYLLHYYRGNLDNKYSIHLRFVGDNIHLVRLCINGSRHYNEDGSFVGGNHIHIYHYLTNGTVEAKVFSLDKTPFGNPQDLIEDLEKFLKYVHIHDVP